MTCTNTNIINLLCCCKCKGAHAEDSNMSTECRTTKKWHPTAEEGDGRLNSPTGRGRRENPCQPLPWPRISQDGACTPREGGEGLQETSQQLGNTAGSGSVAASAVRVMIMGKTGAGKSSLGNTLLGRDAFHARSSFTSVTELCGWEYADCHGIHLEVTDTPGVSDTHREEKKILTEIGKSIAVACPGPHAVLMVVMSGRFTKEEYDAYKVLKELFGEAITKFIIIVFTRADDMPGNTPEERMQWLKSEIPRFPDTLKEVLNDCNGRIYAISNKDPAPQRNQQAQQLVRQIQELMQQNRQKYFSNAMIQDINARVEQLVKAREQTERPAGAVSAHIEVRQEIVNNEVDPGFLVAIGGIAGAGAGAALVAVGAAAATAGAVAAGAAGGGVVGAVGVAIAVSMCSVM